MKKKLVINMFFILISLASASYAAYQLHSLGALPFKYEVSVIGVLFVVVLLIGLLAVRLKNKYISAMMKFLLIIVSVCLCVGGYFVQEGFATFRRMTTPEAKVNEMSLITLIDSESQSVEDIDTMVFVPDGSSYFNTTMEVVKQLNSDIRFTIIQDYNEALDMLYNAETDALLIREASRFTLEEMKPSFAYDTKVIWNYLITEEVSDFSKDVNVVNTPFNIYLTGIDMFGDISYVSRSDVNMIATVNPNTKQVLLTSIPRDTWVVLDNMGDYDKLTHSGLEGPENTVKTVENFLGIEINYYARVNFSSLVNLVDAIDGIEVNNPVAFSVGTNDFEEGTISLNGDLALIYARERHAFDYMFSDTEQGDQIRVENQQRVVEGLVNKLISPALLTHFQDLLEAVEGTFETNLSTDEMMSLVKMQLEDMSSWIFFNQKVTGEYDYRYGGAYMPDWELIYYIPDESSVTEIQNQINIVLNNGMLEK